MTTTLDDLEDRIAVLEKQSLAEVNIPNYLTINPQTGRIGANFSGVINALGITLPEGVPPGAIATNKIQWTRANGATDAGGQPPGQLSVFDNPSGTDDLDILANAVPPNTHANIIASASVNDAGSGYSGYTQLAIQHDETHATSSRLYAQTQQGGSGTHLTLLDAAGNSDLVYGYSPANKGANPQPFTLGNFAQASVSSLVPIGAAGWNKCPYNTMFGSNNDGPYDTTNHWYLVPTNGVYAFWHQALNITPAGAGTIPIMYSAIGTPSGATIVGSMLTAPNAASSWNLGGLCFSIIVTSAGTQVVPWIYTNVGGQLGNAPYSYFGGIQLL